ncbi:hypothetical protein KNT89_gp78 [Gordonia phage Petra]|uniref:Uncharacterized protein n=2 Tax=root TaxID=1 RepID=A0A2U8UL27_9CAUD|nr:hypothetical protein [Gordonia westfalica]YP_010095472.1 hypothetical protein KNT89_gp78 [Gordonia phage Petra]AWN04191.1 hypothetical protein PBI_PETRA_78 [Gordonia phage Petra]SDU64844.1 hypothetical protein SAMN04488548_1342957 [Gordonia westfalica]
MSTHDSAIMLPPDAELTIEPTGVWIAYYGDNSGATAFPSEIEALRHAVGTSMLVHHVAWGSDIFTGRERP